MPPKHPWMEELSLLQQILRKTELVPATKWGAEVFTCEGRNVVSYGGFKNYFSLWFYNGVFLNDPYQVLVNAQEGKTKALRQWRFSHRDEIDEARILEYVHEAIRNEKQGKSWKPERSEAPPIPDILAQAIAEESAVKEAFDRLTPYKQKEYIEYIGGAKQEKTRISRLEKAIALILEGKGLNDKYQ